VDKENDKLRAARLDFESRCHTALVRFYCPGHLRFIDPLLVPVAITPPGTGTWGDASASGVSEGDFPPAWAAYVELEVDVRMTVPQLLEHFVGAVGTHVATLGLLLDRCAPPRCLLLLPAAIAVAVAVAGSVTVVVAPHCAYHALPPASLIRVFPATGRRRKRWRS